MFLKFHIHLRYNTQTKSLGTKTKVHFFGKNPNPDSESKKGYFVSLVKSKTDYESNDDSMYNLNPDS